MNDTATDHDALSAPLPFPTKEERDALILEFQRLAARLTQAGLISRVSSDRLMRSMNRERRYAEDKRHALPELVLNILLGIEEGTLKEREHFMRLKDEHIAVHLASAGPALFKAGRGRLTQAEARSLFHFGWLHFRNVVVARSERARFGPEEDRRRVVVLHVPSAYEFVGARLKPVPSR
jgi:hypothetical protein